MKIISDLILKKIKPQTPPIWLMRQAGRYMREYNEIRSKYKNFMDFCYNYKETSEVTLQPIRKFNFDAAIIFSDILVVPDSLGIEVVFKEGYGPVIDFDKNKNIIKPTSKNNDKFSCISEAIKLTKIKLKEEGYENKDLIGFSGSPFTLLTYILERKRNNIFNFFIK
jgi:uroporphyrinogen decarboxylase